MGSPAGPAHGLIDTYPGKWSCVLFIVLAMLLIMVLAGVIVLYVAYPHRGEEMPYVPQVGEAMRKGVDMLPTLDNQRQDQPDDQRDQHAA